MKLRFLALPALALLGLTLTACDSSDSDSDAATIEGQWRLTAISDQNSSSAGSPRDLTAGFNSLVNRLSFDFDDGDYTLVVDYNSQVNNLPPSQGGRADVTVEGSYSVNESAKTLTLNVPVGSGTTPVTFNYNVDTDNQVTFTGNAAATQAVNVVLNPTTPYAANLQIVVQRL